MNGGISMLTVKHISKRYGNIEAVKNVSFHVDKGKSFAFLGTNGAGKSTVIYMIMNLLKPDEGTIKFTKNESIGVVFQSHRLDDEFTIEQNLMMRAKFYDLDQSEAKQRIEILLKLTGLYSKRKRMYGKCSGGEKRKTDIIRALIHQPSFLILDEPTTGLDANSREEIWKLLKQLQVEQALTIFLTTHYIEEAEDVDYVLMMHEGEIEVEGTPDQLRNQYAQTTLHIFPYNMLEFEQLFKQHNYIYTVKNNQVIVPLKKSKEAIAILSKIEAYIQDFSITKASLEHVYLQVTNQVKGRMK